MRRSCSYQRKKKLFALFVLTVYLLQQPLDQSQTGGNGGLGIGAVPGGQLLSTALGMTRAVTSFLGAALKVRVAITLFLTVSQQFRLLLPRCDYKFAHFYHTFFCWLLFSCV